MSTTQQNENKAGSLRASLATEPVILKFGTSGRRGLVKDLTQLEVYINALAELQYLLSLSQAEGGIKMGDEFFFAYDLRPSSTRFVAEQGGCGEVAQAIVRAITDAGLRAVNLGAIPTPALTCYALERGRGGIMVTGSHIPFDRNGYKTNSAKGELLKKDEAPINELTARVRQQMYAQPFDASPFNREGRFKCGPQALPAVDDAGQQAYVERYLRFFAGNSLRGQRLLVYQHSAVGRDLLADLLANLGAEVVPAGRSDTFVPIDTEAIDDAQLEVIQTLASQAWKQHGPLDAVVSMDGDSDRPLVLSVDALPAAGAQSPPCRVRFFGGDLLGMLVAEYLRADAVVVPISCNDAVDRGPLQACLEPKTRIGSPYVVAGMERARAKGRRAVCGWEANGGFLTGSDIELNGELLKSLPTRDAVLPILSLLFSKVRAGVTLSGLFDRLPRRFSKAALLRNFPRPVSLRIVQRFSPGQPNIKEVRFADTGLAVVDETGQSVALPEPQKDALSQLRAELGTFFTKADGFGDVERLNFIDGVRIYFDNGDVAHIRPSGNADEFRIYAVADSQERADTITRLGIAEPDGILRKLEQLVS